MKHPLAGNSPLLLAATLVACALAARPLASQTPTNWRIVETVKFGRFQSRVEVSSARTIRVVSAVDTSRLISPDVEVDSALAWHDRLISEIDKPASRQYTLGNAVLIEPYAADTDRIGYLMTLADTLGNARQVIMDKPTMEQFLDLVATGVTAAKIFSDAELRKPNAVTASPVDLAKPYTAVYPRTAQLVGISGRAVMQFTVDTSGKAVRQSIETIEASYKDFSDAARAAILEMEFIPAMMDGHKIERLVQIPFDFKLNTALPIRPFTIPLKR